MTLAMTAEDIFSHVQQMPAKERIRFFSLIATSAFKEDSTHEEVFGHLKNTRFSAEQAAEYLEVSLPTLRRYVQSGRLKPSHIVGRSQLFSTADLRRLKIKRA
jgi:excisionase family DNA binding protein